MWFINYSKEQQQRLITQLRKEVYYEEYLHLDIIHINNSILDFYKFDKEQQKNISFSAMNFKNNNQVQKICKKYVWQGSQVANIQKFYKILVYMRKND